MNDQKPLTATEVLAARVETARQLIKPFIDRIYEILQGTATMSDALEVGDYKTAVIDPARFPLRHCEECEHHLGDTLQALRCPLFGRPRVGVKVACAVFTPIGGPARNRTAVSRLSTGCSSR